MEAEIRDILQEFGVSFKTNSKSFIMACPRCRKEEKLYIRRHDGRFVCWYCAESDNFKGKPEFALRELTGVPLVVIQNRLYGIDTQASSDFHIHIDMGEYTDSDDEIIFEDKVQEVLEDPELVPLSDPRAALGVEYLEKRGIPLAIANEYRIKYWISRRRVVFPVYDGERYYGNQARAIYKTDPFWDEDLGKMVRPLKIVTSTDLDRERLVMFGDRLKGSDHAVICEGPIDALKAHLCGGNIATMGKAVSSQQLELIRNSGIRKVYLGLDPDAYREIQKVYRIFSDLEVYDLRPPAGYSDLGAMPMEAVKEMFDRARPMAPGQIFIHMKNLYGVK